MWVLFYHENFPLSRLIIESCADSTAECAWCKKPRQKTSHLYDKFITHGNGSFIAKGIAKYKHAYIYFRSRIYLDVACFNAWGWVKLVIDAVEPAYVLHIITVNIKAD